MEVIIKDPIKPKKIQFSQLKKRTGLTKITEEDQESLNYKESTLGILDTDPIKERLNEFIFNEKIDKNDNQVPLEDFEKTRYNSNDSFPIFFNKFHKFEILNRKGTINTKTPSMAFISGCKLQKVYPNPVGLMKRKGNDFVLELKNHRLGDSYLLALCESFQYSDHVRELKLSGNRLTELSICPLLKTIKDNMVLYKRIEVLDLSYNFLNYNAIASICNFISDPTCEIKELNLEGNNIGDQLASKICESILKGINEKITVLNLAKNELDKASLSIAQVVEQCVNLKILIISWNDIRNYGASEIIRKLQKHREIRVLDISWNSIGSNLFEEQIETTNSRKLEKISTVKENKGNKEKDKEDKPEVMTRDIFELIKSHNFRKNQQSSEIKGVSLFAKELAEFFKSPEPELYHLDISHNNINYNDSKFLSEECKIDHRILGIHCDGNEMRIDELGFIHPLSKGKMDGHYAHSQIYYPIDLTASNIHLKTKIRSIKKIKAKNNCWICENYKQTEFRFTLPDNYINPNVEAEIEVFLHLSIDNWNPYEMIKMSNKKNQYAIYRMCPPGEVTFFFTVGDEVYFNTSHPLSTRTKPHESFKYTINRRDYINEIDIKTEVEINEICRIFVDKGHIVDENLTKAPVSCEPRPEKNKKLYTRPRTPWSFPISIWAAYDYLEEGDTEEFLDDVFENDFARISKNKKDGSNDPEMMSCKNLLRSYFRKLLETYRFYSAYGGSTLFYISLNALGDFCDKCKDLFDPTYSKNDVYLKETEVKGLDKDLMKKYKKPDNMVRHHFMLLLVRIAKDKYIRTKQKQSLYEAVKDSFELHYQPAIEGFSFHQWRLDRYYNEKVDNFLKSHLPLFNAIFMSWAKKKDPGKKEIWMILEEFDSFCKQIVDEEFPARDIALNFNYSIRTQVNEIETDRIYYMFFPEFLEGFCRIIDEFSPIPPGQPKEEWDKERRNSQELITKLENIVLLLPKLIFNPDFKLVKEKFPLPIKEVDTGLYKFDMKGQFYMNMANSPKKIFDTRRISNIQKFQPKLTPV